MQCRSIDHPCSLIGESVHVEGGLADVELRLLIAADTASVRSLAVFPWFAQAVH
ncbi:MAG: hypothetical protein GY847_22905 [Proteobacteria bacterium]|nr:hypothetical protein [Pseudomonadota bacterium]